MPAARWAVGVVALACCLRCAPQDTSQRMKEAAKSPKGTVTGTVYCADTNAPARLASVKLVQAGGETSRQFFSLQLGAQTDLDGRFTMQKVPEGTYYVMAEFPGYLKSLPLSREVELKPLTDEEIKKFGADAPRVSVSTKQTATVSIRLERGAEIDGSVLYDDGSPAVGLHVIAHPKSAAANSKQPEPEQNLAALFDFAETFRQETDDHGRFRILGLAPGEYVVGVAIPANSADDPGDGMFSRIFTMSPIGSLMVYQGDTLRASKARPIKIEAGDATKEADITIPLSKLHTIRGHIIFKSTGEAPPTAGLQLLYADSREVARYAIATDGDFALTYVGEDSYILRAAGTSERLPTFEEVEDGDVGTGGRVGFLAPVSGIGGVSLSASDSNSGKDFPGAEVPVVVTGDVSGITISVPDPPAAKTGAEPANAHPAAQAPQH